MIDPVTKANAGRGRARAAVVAMCLAMGMAAWAQTAATPAKPHTAHRKPPAGTLEQAPVITPAAVQPETPPAPELPKYPVNENPAAPMVTWDSHGLRISAANASLSRILDEVSTETGAKVEGVSGDERVFGEYGPGQARDVLAELLTGSGYDYLLIGDQGQGTPRQIVLSMHHASATNTAGGNAARPTPEPQDEDAQENEEPPQPQPMMARPPMPPQMNQPGGMRTPQQRMMELQQQRLQQMQQQNQQNQQPQQQ
jgi:hypothetical protein